MRVTTSGGAQSVYILSTYPYHGYGVAVPVTGAHPGLWRDIADPGRMAYDQGGKGVKVSLKHSRVILYYKGGVQNHIYTHEHTMEHRSRAMICTTSLEPDGEA